MASIADLSAVELIDAYRRGALSPLEVARDVLARIEKAAAFNAFLPIRPEPVLEAATASERRWRAKSPLGAIDGLPTTIKDNILQQGEPTRRGSRTGKATPEPADAPAVARLREHGAVFVGKTALPEYGWIGACHSPLTGITRNPWNAEHTPGGSTGGGAVAALLGLGVLHLGTDGAGSLRIPAAFTGVFGFKPTYGRVPAYPPSPFNVLAHQGPIARRIADAALMLSVISGPDARDMTAWNTPAEDFTAGLDDGVRGLRIALSPRLGGAAKPDAGIEAAVRKAAKALEEQGAIVEAGGKILGRRIPRGHVARIRRRDHRQHQRRIGNATRDRPLMREHVERRRRIGRHPAIARFHAEHAGEGRGDAQAASAVGAEMQHAQAQQRRDRTAARRTTGRMRGIPRVAGDAGERTMAGADPAIFGQRGLADEDGALLAQPPDRRRIGIGWRRLARARAAPGRLAFEPDIVFDRCRQPVDQT